MTHLINGITCCIPIKYIQIDFPHLYTEYTSTRIKKYISGLLIFRIVIVIVEYCTTIPSVQTPSMEITWVFLKVILWIITKLSYSPLLNAVVLISAANTIGTQSENFLACNVIITSVWLKGRWHYLHVNAYKIRLGTNEISKV